MGEKVLYALCFAIIVLVAYLAVELSPAPARTEIRVRALLCGESPEHWDALLIATSQAIVESGGIPLINAGSSQGCPGGFVAAYLDHLGDNADILVIADGSPDGRLVSSVCGPQDGGCAPIYGSVLFLGYLDHFYARGALAHELGHCLGLNHADDQNDVMYPVAGYGNVLTSDYLNAMRGYGGGIAITASTEAITCGRMQR